jgi:hypothetical protein
MVTELTAAQHQEAQRIHAELARIQEEKDSAKEELDSITAWLNDKPLMDEHDVIRLAANDLNVTFTAARKAVEKYPKEYSIQEHDIPSIIKQMRLHRRTLKGDSRLEMTKAIETLIYGYSDYLDTCIKSIYWLADYSTPLKQMRFSEGDLRKLHSIKDVNTRREVVDSLCKYWEAELERKDLGFNVDYANLSKEMTSAKKSFRAVISSISHQSIRKSLTEETHDFIIKSVCSSPGISAKQIHDTMPPKLYTRNSSQTVAKAAVKLNITQVNGSYYKLPSIKKDLYAYTAAFIDSDGYITMDKNYNPRVGLVATGDRGKAFMIEIHKALGVGKLHLDQKSPQGTRPVNRLNFYSQGDITELLTKCRPHFRMKGPNADLLLELIRMKKSYKKADWYKNRCEEIFKLMKYENHKDHVGYDFAKYNVDIETVAKLHENCKMNLMNELEGISTPILK